MEAELVESLPQGEPWRYEPKWDGFRCLAFRDGSTVELQSKAGQPLGRYFPDVVAALAALGAKRFVIDGEIVIPVKGALSFDDLLMRIHPAESRVKKLAAEHPAQLIAFDMLVDDEGRSLVGEPLAVRREALDAFAEAYFTDPDRLRISPWTCDLKTAKKWLDAAGGALDGVVAKRADLPYQGGERTGMQKIKRIRTADCVVGGFRRATSGGGIGSLLLGLYNDEGSLDYVGFTSGLTRQLRAEFTRLLEPLRGPSAFGARAPGGPSRWSRGRSTEWEPVRPEIVVEVAYDQMTNGRFRHGTRFLRMRPDKLPKQCTRDQLYKRSGRMPRDIAA
jgi:ATP-dependent DNA ligase